MSGRVAARPIYKSRPTGRHSQHLPFPQTATTHPAILEIQTENALNRVQ